MSGTIPELLEKMAAASQTLDFEEGKLLRDRMSQLRGGATEA